MNDLDLCLEVVSKVTPNIRCWYR